MAADHSEMLLSPDMQQDLKRAEQPETKVRLLQVAQET
jgi:hypothetical protein